MAKVKGARFNSDVSLVNNTSGAAFKCGECMYYRDGKCYNKNPKLYERDVEKSWCCNLYDHEGMKLII